MSKQALLVKWTLQLIGIVVTKLCTIFGIALYSKKFLIYSSISIKNFYFICLFNLIKIVIKAFY